MPQQVPKKILIADDSPTVREVLRSFLEKEGFQVALAEDGVDAIEKIYEVSPDLLLLDIAMPRMKGYQVCRFLKKNKATSDIPIVMLTVKTEKEDFLWGKDSGAQDYISKDVLKDNAGFTVLLNRIKQLTEDFKSRDISRPLPSQDELLSLVNDLLDDELRKSRILTMRLSSLSELSNHLFITARGKLYAQIMDVCLKQMDADSGFIMILDPRSNALCLVSSFGIIEENARDSGTEIAGKISDWLLQHKEPLPLIDSAEKYPFFSHLLSRSDIGSSIYAPVLIENKVKGILNMFRVHPKPGFNNEDWRFAMTMANYLASAIEKEKLYSDLLQSEKMGSLGFFASSMAHDIRNPLASISTEAQYLAGKFPGAEGRESLQVIVRESERISDILERLLAFCQPRERAIKPIDLNSALEGALKLIRHTPPLNKIEIIKMLPDSLPKVMATALEVEAVFVNILINAIQAMPDGGKIEISPDLKKGFIGMKFKDSGRGIDEENLKLIFEPFFTTKVQGIGLGLFISNQITQSLGGWMEVFSEIGKGTTFTVYLPGG